MRLDMRTSPVVSEAVLASDLEGFPAHSIESAIVRCSTDRTSGNALKAHGTVVTV